MKCNIFKHNLYFVQKGKAADTALRKRLQRYSSHTAFYLLLSLTVCISHLQLHSRTISPSIIIRPQSIVIEAESDKLCTVIHSSKH